MKRMFLVGSPRSGTTLLQSLLGCSPSVTTFTESHLFSRSFSSRLKFAPAHRDPRIEVKRFWNENDLPSREMLAQPMLAVRYSRIKLGQYYLSVLDRAAGIRHKHAWLEKTPRHLHYIADIEASGRRGGYPVQFIHLVRDGVSVAASLFAASANWRRQRSVGEALSRWQKDVTISASYAEKPNHHIVIYEQLVQHPEQIVTALAKQLGIELTVADCQRRDEVLSQIVRSDESWKLDTAGESIEQLGRSQQHATAEQLTALESEIDRRDYQKLIRCSVIAIKEPTGE